MSIEIRPFTAADIDAVLSLERASFSLPWSRADFEYELSCPDSVFFVAQEDENILGFVIVRLEDIEAEVYNIAVDSGCRGHGLGGRLLDAALDKADKSGVENIFLEVRASNEPAKRLYLSRGFTTAGIRKRYYESPVEDAIVMVRSKESGN